MPTLLEINESLESRLLKRRKIDPDTGCWIWTGATSNGRGHIRYKNKDYRVHQVAAQIWLGSIFPQVNHKRECRNRLCFNPDHLYLGTQSENMKDAFDAGTVGQDHYWGINERRKET